MAPPKKFDHDEARALRVEGYSVGDIADMLGVTKGAISQATAGVSPTVVQRRSKANPETFTEMRDLAAQEIWRQFTSLKGVAQIQAFNAIRELAKQDPGGGDDGEPEPLIADVVSGVSSLSVERKREILTTERARLVEELEAIERVLADEVVLV